MSGIFLSYRTVDQGFGAAMLDEELVEHFGEDRVFRDDRALPLGANFSDVLWSRLRTSEVMLVLIGPHWFARDAAGRRLIDDDRDFVRREIAEAFRLRLRVVPVLLGGAPLPGRDDLPKGVRGLARRQYLEIRARDPRPDIARLVRRLEKQVPSLRPAPGAATASPAGHGNVYVNGPVRAGKDVVMRDKIVHRDRP